MTKVLEFKMAGLVSTTAICVIDMTNYLWNYTHFKVLVSALVVGTIRHVQACPEVVSLFGLPGFLVDVDQGMDYILYTLVVNSQCLLHPSQYSLIAL